MRGLMHRIVHRHHILSQSKLFFDGKVKILYKDHSKIILNKDLFLGYNSCGDNGRSSIIRLDNNTSFIVTGNARLFYGSDIYLFENAVFSIGNSYINSNCFIRCSNNITIGNGCAISSNFTAFDSDFHWMKSRSELSKPIIIEDNVWIGANVTILKGVTIGAGSVVAAGSVVTKSIPEKCLVAGVPARILKTQIEWCM